MVKKILVLIVLIIVFATGANAQTRVAGASATMAASVKNEATASASLTDDIKDYAAKKRAIISVLEEYNSPMIDHVDSFMKSCMEQKFDCYLLPAIAGHESRFGTLVWPGSNNAFGWGGGYIMFADWGEGIETVGSGLRNNYVTEGPIVPEMIGSKYAASTSWASKVTYYMGLFARAEESQLQSTDFALE